MNGMLYTIGGVQAKLVDQYDLERRVWADESFPLLNYFRVAHGVVAAENGTEIYVMGMLFNV